MEMKPGPKQPIISALGPLAISIPSNTESLMAMVIDRPGCVDWIIWAWAKISKDGEAGDRKKVGEELLKVPAMVASF